MKINVTLPFDGTYADEFLSPEGVEQVSQAAEAAGFLSGLVTDHPAPTGRWLDAGGHHAQDPFVLLAFIAATTKTLRLQTGIVVLPYRNPFITARCVSTLDILSRGRVSLGIGTGYLKGEYKALGVDFEKRGELTDEYLRAMKAAWTQDEFTFEGTGYSAPGNRIHPRPVQQPHPPLVIGGNANPAIRRAVELGDAWNPFPTASATLAATARTVEFSTDEDIAKGIAYMKAHCEKVGRATPPEVILGGLDHIGSDDWEAQPILDRIGRLEAIGVSTVAINIAADTIAQWTDRAAAVGERLVAKAA